MRWAGISFLAAQAAEAPLAAQKATILEEYGRNIALRLSQEYAQAFTHDPAALMVMARKLSKLSSSCGTGFSYISAASRSMSHEIYVDPSSNIIAAGNIAADLASSHQEARRDLAQNLKLHPLADMETISVNNPEFPKLALALSQRLFTGGDRFDQNWRAAIDLLENLHRKGQGSKGSLEYLIAMYNKLSSDPTRGFAGPTALKAPGGDGGVYISAAIAARAALTLLPKHDAHDLLGLTLIRLASEARSAELRRGLLLEARMQFARNPLSTFNSLALDLILAAPIMSQALFSVVPTLHTWDPTAVNVLSHMIMESSCNESWALSSTAVRKYLWFHANKWALRRSDVDLGTPRSKRTTNVLLRILMSPFDALQAVVGPSSSSISNEMLARLAEAGVEEAEWSLALRLEDDHPAKNNLLSFSAHKGRAAAQLDLARLGKENTARYNTRKLLHSKMPFPTTSHKQGQSDDKTAAVTLLDEEAAIIDLWEARSKRKAYTLSDDEIKLANLQLITETPSRWEGYGVERGSVFLAPYTEAILLQSWAAFFGKGRDQSLRDCLVILNNVPSRVVKYSYLTLYQALLILNAFLLRGKMIAVYMLYILAMSFW